MKNKHQAIVKAVHEGDVHDISRFASGPENIASITKELQQLSNTSQRQAIISADDYLLFRMLAKEGQVYAVKCMFQLCEKHQRGTMLRAKDYGAFRCAANNSDLEMVNSLIDLCPSDELQSMISIDHYVAFRKAVKYFYIDIVDRLLQLCNKNKILYMICSGQYRAFYPSANKKHIQIISRLSKKFNDHEIKSIISSNHSIFIQAANGGAVDDINYILKLCMPDEVQLMIEACDYQAFCGAALNGHLEIITLLLEICAPESKQSMLEANSHIAFRYDNQHASDARLAVITHLIDISSQETLSSMIINCEFNVLYPPVYCQRLDLINCLLAVCPTNKLQNMLAGSDKYFRYKAFQKAVEQGCIAIVDRLLEVCTPNQQKIMIKLNDYDAFKQAANGNKHTMVNHLLNIADPATKTTLMATDEYKRFYEWQNHDKDFPYSTPCENCKKTIHYMMYSGMSGCFPHFYCIDCSNVFWFRSYKEKLPIISRSESFSKTFNYHALLADISQALPSCDCGGQFAPGTNPKCPHCQYESKHQDNIIERLTNPFMVVIKGSKYYTG